MKIFALFFFAILLGQAVLAQSPPAFGYQAVVKDAGETLLPTSQLLSVPYTLYSKDVLNKNDSDADPANELQKITLSGAVLTLDKSGESVALPSSGGGDNWGTQAVMSTISCKCLTVSEPIIK
jgi:hypothetical protein